VTAMPRLIAVGGPENGREYLLDQAETTLGRDNANTLLVTWDVRVSRQHARISCHTGLFWLEDLNSKHGTFLTLADGEERKLPPHDPTLLLDGARLRLGFDARFQVLGVIASQDDTVRLLLSRLQQELNDLYAGLPYLTPESRERQSAQLQNLEARLKEAQSETELLRLVAEGIPTLSIAEWGGERGPEPLSPPPPDALPPLPDGLPDPDDPNYLKSILNTFIGDIRARFPGAEEEEGGADE